MSETSTPKAPGRTGNEAVIFLVVGAAFLGLLFMLGGGAERPLHKSATGMQGAVTWLRAQEVDALTFEGGGRLTRNQVALRILPIYDTDLENDRETPDSREEVIAETSEVDFSPWVFTAKLRALPTLVVLPKWRAGMRKLGVAHRDLLIPDVELNRLLRQIGVDGGRIQRSSLGWEERLPPSAGPDLTSALGLMHAQELRDIGTCEPILGSGQRVLMARCAIADNADYSSDSDDQTHFWLLTDPDLISNHGLAWAGNGEALLAIVRQFELEHPVVVDLTTRFLTRSEDWQMRQHERTWEDFRRMFRWPFTMIWIAFFALGGLVLWRAIKRYGPLAHVYTDEPGASKTIAIDAKARLLRMANHDGALLANHIQARLAHLVSELLGPHRAADKEPLDVLTRLIGRRNSELADELSAASSVPMGGAESPADIIRRLDRFETAYERVTDEFGRTATAG